MVAGAVSGVGIMVADTVAGVGIMVADTVAGVGIMVADTVAGVGILVAGAVGMVAGAGPCVGIVVAGAGAGPAIGRTACLGWCPPGDHLAGTTLGAASCAYCALTGPGGSREPWFYNWLWDPVFYTAHR